MESAFLHFPFLRPWVRLCTHFVVSFKVFLKRPPFPINSGIMLEITGKRAKNDQKGKRKIKA